MNSPKLLMTAVLAFVPVVTLAQSDLKGKPITFRACITQGIPVTTVRLTGVTEVGSIIPTPSQPLQIVYWMDKTQEPQFKQNLGSKVEVTGTISDVPDQKVSDLTANDGVFGFETKTPASTALAATGAGTEPEAVRTSGAAEDEPESRLLKINVEKVRMIGSCR